MEYLNERFGIKDAISFSAGPMQQPKVLLKHRSGDQLEVYVYGGHVGKWISKGNDILFETSKVLSTPGKPIRGGVPIIFPQFGPGPIQSHGFARNTQWAVTGSKVDEASGDVCIELTLRGSEYSMAMWKHAFSLVLVVTLSSGRLNLGMRVTNTSKEAFSFQSALHTYFSVGNIDGVRVAGLGGIEYLDNLNPSKENRPTQVEPVVIDREVDRVYTDVSSEAVTLSDTHLPYSLVLRKKAFPDMVVWNPWIDRSLAQDRRPGPAGVQEVRVRRGCDDVAVHAGALCAVGRRAFHRGRDAAVTEEADTADFLFPRRIF